MKLTALVLALALCACAVNAKNLYVDVSVGGDQYAQAASVGVNYPIAGDIWGTIGGWVDFAGNIGPYWGVSYAWAPFAGEE